MSLRYTVNEPPSSSSQSYSEMKCASISDPASPLYPPISIGLVSKIGGSIPVASGENLSDGGRVLGPREPTGLGVLGSGVGSGSDDASVVEGLGNANCVGSWGGAPDIPPLPF